MRCIQRHKNEFSEKELIMRKTLAFMVLAVTAMLASCGGTKSGSASRAAKLDYPVKAIDLVVPFAAGGNVDLSCRILASELEKLVGKPVTVLNKEGGGAIIGQTYVVNAAPDGYTTLALTSSFVTNVLGGSATYTMDDIVPIAMYCFDPELIVASGSSGIVTYDQFVAAGKQRRLLNSTPGFSTSHHIASLIYTEKTGIQFDYLHTNGSAEQVVQLAGGHADVGMTTYGGAASLIDQGKIKVIAICADERSSILPDVPTLKELGLDFTYGAYRGIGAPKSTDPEIINYLSDHYRQVLETPGVIDQFNNSGFPVVYKNARDFSLFLQEDYKNMEAIMHLLES
jgi:tripartite-type tricarboxylate transporter receptor subunit TctC